MKWRKTILGLSITVGAIDVSKYRIQIVAQLTGLSSDVIRAWQNRYSFVTPERSPAGYRLYSDEDVAVLRGVKHLVDSGIAPMQVSTLAREEILRAAASPADPAPADPTAPRDAAAAADASPGSRADPPPSLPDILCLDEALFAVRTLQVVDAFAAFDLGRVERLFATPLAVLPPEVVCQRLLMPILREVGKRWRGGSLGIAGAHFGSHLVRSKIIALIEAAPLAPGARRVVCAGPPGEQQDIALLRFTLRARLQGWQPINLGANLPIEELAGVVARTQPELVGLLYSERVEAPALAHTLTRARALIGAGSHLVVGGRGIKGMAEVVREAGCALIPASGRLEALLAPA